MNETVAAATGLPLYLTLPVTSPIGGAPSPQPLARIAAKEQSIAVANR
jgi:hypothetical protein